MAASGARTRRPHAGGGRSSSSSAPRTRRQIISSTHKTKGRQHDQVDSKLLVCLLAAAGLLAAGAASLQVSAASPAGPLIDPRRPRQVSGRAGLDPMAREISRREQRARHARATKRAAGELTRIVAVSGQTIEMQCPLAGELAATNPPPPALERSIIWRKDGQPLNQMNSTRLRLATSATNSSGASSTLTIFQTQPKLDESTYECALAESPARTYRFELRLLVPPRLAPFEMPRDAQVGMKVLLTCSALEGQQPISFVWLKDERLIVDGESAAASTSSLAQFHRQQLADKSALSAHAALELGPVSSEYVLVTPTKRPATSAARFRPNSEHYSEHLDVDDADDADDQLDLAADEASESKERPTSAGHSHSNNNNNNNNKSRKKSSMHLVDPSIKIRQADDFSILSIDSIELKHAGRYTCSAQNEAARVQHSSQLVINAPPTLTIEPQDANLVSGQSLVIECAASGQPRPTLSWSRVRDSNNKQLDLVPIYDNLRYSILANGSLAITNATQREQGLYMCAARNGFGPEASKLVRLTVHEPARVASRYKIVESRIEERGQLTCQASGESPLSIQWLDKDSKPIDSKSGDKRLIVDTAPMSSTANSTLGQVESSLFITRTQRSDSGHFTCLASNKFGQDKQVINLLVQDVPDKVAELKVTNTTATTVSLRWQLGFTGNAPVSSYLVQYQSEDPLDDLLASGQLAESLSSAPPSRRQLTAEQLLNELTTSGDSSAESLGAARSSLRATLDMLTGAGASQSSESAANGSALVAATAPADEAIDRTLVELTVQQTATSLVVKDLSPACTYRLRLAGINKVGLGEFSDWIRAKTEEAPPSGSAAKMLAVATGPNSVKLSWWPPERRAWNGQLVRFLIGYRPIDSAFELQKSVDWSAPALRAQSLMAQPQRLGTAQAPSNDSSTLGGTRVSLRQQLRQLLAWQQQELVAHLTNLQRSTTYLVWIQAVNSRGPGPQSHAISVKTLDDVPPSAPALRVQSTSANSITLTWSMLSNFVSPANVYSLFFRRVPPFGRAHQHYYPTLRQQPQLGAAGQPLNDSTAALEAQAALAAAAEPGPFLERTISSQELLVAASREQARSSAGEQQQQQFVYTLEGLECGSAYELYMTTRNSVGKSEPSPVVSTRTRGEPPLAPHNKNHLFARIGASDVLLDLASWSTGGCPLTHVTVRYKQTALPSAAAATSGESAANSSAGPMVPGISTGWPVSASVPAELLSNINQQSAANRAAAASPGRQHGVYVSSSLPAASDAHLLGGDQTGAHEAPFALRNLQPSTGYELEISAHNAAGLTTAAYEFVTAGPNGTRAGYTRREGVFRLDQRGQPLDSSAGQSTAFEGDEQAPFAGESRDVFSLRGLSGGGGGGQAALQTQMAPLLLTLLCLVCLLMSTSFCYYRLADSWKQRRGSDSLEGDTMRSVCGADTQLGASSPGATQAAGSKLNWTRLNGHQQNHQHHQHQHHSHRNGVNHAELVDERRSPSDAGADSPPQPSMSQHLAQTTTTSGHCQRQQQFWPPGGAAGQAVSMKEFNLVPPLGAAATLNFNRQASAHRKANMANGLAKIGASATIARGLFEATSLRQQSYATDPTQRLAAYAKQPQPYAESAYYGPDVHTNVGLANHETSLSTPATYAIPAHAACPNSSHNQSYLQSSGEHMLDTTADQMVGYQCSGSYNEAQANIDACIQHLMDQQRQYAPLLHNANHEADGTTNFCTQQQQSAASISNFRPPQSVIDSSSSSSGIGTDLSAGLHLDCATTSSAATSNQTNGCQQVGDAQYCSQMATN